MTNDLLRKLSENYSAFKRNMDRLPDPVGAVVNPLVSPLVQQFRRDPMGTLRGAVAPDPRGLVAYGNSAFQQARSGRPIQALASVLQAGAPIGMAGFKPIVMGNRGTMYILHESTSTPGGFRITMMTKGGGAVGHTEFKSLEDAMPQWNEYTKKAKEVPESVVNKAAMNTTPLGRGWNPTMSVPKPKWITLRQEGNVFYYVDDNGNSWGGTSLGHLAELSARNKAKQLGVPFKEAQ